MRAPILAALVLTLPLLVGCKQSKGERCQIDDDCESGLICSQSEKICVDTSVAPVADSAPPALADAMWDAHFDSAVSVPDASPPDAPTPDAGP